MGILGPDTRKFGDKVYVKEAEFQDPTEAKQWQAAYQQQGYSARVVPNPKGRTFDLYVCYDMIPQQPTTNSGGIK